MAGPPGDASTVGGASLDTSGCVWTPHGQLANTYWEDLSPFEQGYVEALFASLARGILGSFAENQREGKCVGFSDLAPETLAAIRTDCKQASKDFPHPDLGHTGEWFWRLRQAGTWPHWKPLTITLSDDGKVRTSTRDGA